MAMIGIKVILGVLFLGLSCVAGFSMLHLMGAPHTPHAKLLRIVHKASGGTAIALYAVLAVMCIASLVGNGGSVSPAIAIHLAFGALFIPFVLLKVTIVEKYPELRSRLFAIGTVLFALTFVIFFTSALAHLAADYRPGASAEVPTIAEEELTLGRELFIIKCAKCHRLDRPLLARKSLS